MSKFGNTKEECINEIETRVSKDLSELLEDNVECKLPIPDNNQIIGVLIGVLISIFYWINRCYTIQVR